MVDMVENGFSDGFPSRKSFSFWDGVKGDSHGSPVVVMGDGCSVGGFMIELCRAMPEFEG